MIKLKEFLSKFHLSKVKLNGHLGELEFEIKSDDEDAAWEMYVELITRVLTQELEPETGDEKTALNSVYSIFDSTRNVLRDRGRNAQSFSKVAVVILNQIVRPFTAKWHRISIEGGFSDSIQCALFREELHDLQTDLRCYASLLADMAKVEDITYIDGNMPDYYDVGEIEELPAPAPFIELPESETIELPESEKAEIKEKLTLY